MGTFSKADLGPKMVFAIRIGNHVEFRSSRTKPKAVVSKLTTTVENNAGTNWYPIWRSRKVTLKQTFFVGGRVIGYVPASRFEGRFRVKVPQDKLIKLKGPLAENVMNRNWRRTNL